MTFHCWTTRSERSLAQLVSGSDAMWVRLEGREIVPWQWPMQSPFTEACTDSEALCLPDARVSEWPHWKHLHLAYKQDLLK